MKWKNHYSGIETAEVERLGVNLYLQRERKDRKLTFLRLSIPRHMVGLFIGRGNYVKGDGGWELFTGGHHIGWSKPWVRHRRWFWVDWSGSMNDPYHSFTWRVRSFGIGGHTPQWAKRRKEAKEEAKYEADMLAYEEECKRHDPLYGIEEEDE